MRCGWLQLGRGTEIKGFMSGATMSIGPLDVDAMNINHDNEPECCWAWPSGFIWGKLDKELGQAG